MSNNEMEYELKLKTDRFPATLQF